MYAFAGGRPEIRRQSCSCYTVFRQRTFSFISLSFVTEFSFLANVNFYLVAEVMRESIVFCGACTMPSSKKFTFAISSADERIAIVVVVNVNFDFR